MPYILQHDDQHNLPSNIPVTPLWSQHNFDNDSVKSGCSDMPKKIPPRFQNGFCSLQRPTSRPTSRQSLRSVGLRSPLPSSAKDPSFGKGVVFFTPPGYIPISQVLREPHSSLPSPLSMVPEDRAGTPEELSGSGQEIQVQIMSQDDNWGDNTTCITGNTSDQGSMEDLSRWKRELNYTPKLRCQRWFGVAISCILSLAGFLSPLAMVMIPKVGWISLTPDQLRCGAECDGVLISLAFKLLILVIGSWAVFYRSPRATTPRIVTLRALVLLLLFVLLFSYWLFYCVRLIEDHVDLTLHSILLFAGSLADSLLFVHYAAVLLLEIRHQQPQFVVKVVRSPDGETRTYHMGRLSIQRAAVQILEKYYLDFPVYNPYLERLPVAKSKKASQGGSSFKFYDVDGISSNGVSNPPNGLRSSGRRRDSNHNERFYEEHEYERRVRKRRARLITAAEDAFTHIKRLHDEQASNGAPMNPHEAAQAIFPTLARPLQKYLRITRQQPWHTVEEILHNLSTCLSHDASPRAFLESYLNAAPMLQFEKESQAIQSWSLVSDTLLSRSLSDKTMFQLRQNDVSLLITVYSLPHLNISEEIIDPKSNRFTIRLNSETSV